MKRIPLWTLFVTIVVGFVFGIMIAPMIAAMRPLPPAVVKTVTVTERTADVLDTGSSCLYSWNGDTYEWTDARRPLGETSPCPSLQQAKARAEIAANAPYLVVMPSRSVK